MAMLDIVQPKNDDTDEDAINADVLPHEKYAQYWPVIPVSRESNEPIVEWSDNKSLMMGAFPDKFLFGQGIPNRLLTQQNWNHFSLYYDGQFDDPLFIAHGFNQLQRACCIRNSARITGKNFATLRSLGVLANSEEFWRQLIWARDHPHSQEAKSLNAKVSRILSMVGSTIPYRPFERAVTRPKLNAMRYCYGVGSNFVTGAPPEFEDLLTLRLCMKPKYNDPNCAVSKQGFTWSGLPDSICNKTSLRMRMTKQWPFLEAQNFHHKLQILLEAIIGCKTSYKTRRNHDYFQYDQHTYHCIAAFNGVIEPQLDCRLHWHIMLYSSVLSPELLEKVAATTSKSLQCQIGTMLDSITCTTLPCNIHQWYNKILSYQKLFPARTKKTNTTPQLYGTIP
jgi:hypothetical protein